MELACKKKLILLHSLKACGRRQANRCENNNSYDFDKYELLNYFFKNISEIKLYFKQHFQMNRSLLCTL